MDTLYFLFFFWGETHTQTIVENGLREARAIDTEALCIVAGEKAWSIHCEIHVLDDGGNIVEGCNDLDNGCEGGESWLGLAVGGAVGGTLVCALVCYFLFRRFRETKREKKSKHALNMRKLNGGSKV